MGKPQYQNKLAIVLESINGWRQAQGDKLLSQNQLAEMVGITRQGLVKILHEISVPSYSTAIKIHQTLRELQPPTDEPIELLELFPLPQQVTKFDQEFSWLTRV